MEENKDVTPPVPAPVEEPKGAKTPEPNLYAALEEERRLRKEADARAKEAEAQLALKPEVVVQAEDIYSDEGKVLKNQIGQLESKLEDIQRERDLERLFTTYGVLRDKSSEFNEFAKDYPRHKLENVAKLFLAENGLLEEVQPRKGLERPTAGPKDTQPTGMATDDVANLRKTNYTKYIELLRNGQIDPSTIK